MFGGDGDGIIDNTNASANGADNYVHIFVCELSNFWPDMNPDNYPGGSACARPGLPASTSGVGKNVPAAKLGKSTSIFIASALANGPSAFGPGFAADPANPQNYYAILDGATQAQVMGDACCYYFPATNSTNSAVKPSEALALDVKIDDGIATTGNVISGSITGFSNAGGIFPNPLSTCNDTTTHAYLVQNNSYECTPLIRIGARTGDPQ
ncbi:MAG: hypothetical protein WDN28_29430 [Chthoniobacter sp.]